MEKPLEIINFIKLANQTQTHDYNHILNSLKLNSLLKTENPKLYCHVLNLTLDFLQSIGKVEKSWISGAIFVISKNQTSIIMHAFTNKTAFIIELVTIIYATTR